MKRIILLIGLTILSSQFAFGQIDKTSELFITLKKLDSVIFEEGYNKCNIDKIASVIHKDLEFLHDQGGIANKEQFLNILKRGICSRKDSKKTRKLIESSLDVYPLKKNGKLYAAIQNGEHQFFTTKLGGKPKLNGNAKFNNVWFLENGKWKLKRIQSYGHNGVKSYGERLDANYPKPLFNSDWEINELLKQNNVTSTSIGYINEGKLQQIRAFGEQKVGVPVSNKTIYKVASLTKPVTSLVVMKLVNAGKWNLDEPLYKYHTDPDVKDSPYSKKLTTRLVLSHQTGFPNWRYLKEPKKLSFEFEPGTKTQYSGEGFEYLRKALEKKFKKPLEKMAEELIFEPLEMNDTHFYWAKDMDESRYATQHDRKGKAVSVKKYYKANAAANLLTTIEDYAKFMTHVMGGAGISAELFEDYLKLHSKEKEGVYYGLGWQIFPDLNKGEIAVAHTGSDFGVKTFAIMLPKSKRGIVIFSNAENGIVVTRKIIEEHFGKIGEEIIARLVNQPSK